MPDGAKGKGDSRGRPRIASQVFSLQSIITSILLPRSQLPPNGQRQRLLLRISGQDDDSERRRRRGVSADRRKDLTMMRIAGLSHPRVFYTLLAPCTWPHVDPIAGQSVFLELTVRVRCPEELQRTNSNASRTRWRGDTCPSIFTSCTLKSIFFLMLDTQSVKQSRWPSTLDSCILISCKLKLWNYFANFSFQWLIDNRWRSCLNSFVPFQAVLLILRNNNSSLEGMLVLKKRLQTKT